MDIYKEGGLGGGGKDHRRGTGEKGRQARHILLWGGAGWGEAEGGRGCGKEEETKEEVAATRRRRREKLVL